MLNVKILKKFKDAHTQEIYKINDIFNISESRYNEISSNMKKQGVDISDYLEVLDIEDIDDEETPEESNEVTESEETPEESNEVTESEETPEEVNNKKNKRSKK